MAIATYFNDLPPGSSDGQGHDGGSVTPRTTRADAIESPFESLRVGINNFMSNNNQVGMDKMAMAIQHAIHLMRREDYGTEVQNLGLQLSINILLPLSAELALKGLKQKETTSDSFTKTHDLARLFQEVSPDAQNRVNERFQRYMTQDGETKDKAFDLWDFLEAHRHDFEDWRYLENAKAGSLIPAYEEFQYAICAILDEGYEGNRVVGRSLISD